MSLIGSPAETSLLQTAQAAQVAAKTRQMERAVSEDGRRLRDILDLRVAGVEEVEAVRKLPKNDSGEAEHEHHGQQEGEDRAHEDRPHIDVQA